jgi:hypothetical protein
MPSLRHGVRKPLDAVGLRWGPPFRIANERFGAMGYRSFAIERAGHAAVRRRVARLCALSEPATP